MGSSARAGRLCAHGVACKAECMRRHLAEYLAAMASWQFAPGFTPRPHTLCQAKGTPHAQPPAEREKLKKNGKEVTQAQGGAWHHSPRNRIRGLVTSAMPMFVRFAWPPEMPFTDSLPIKVSLPEAGWKRGANEQEDRAYGQRCHGRACTCMQPSNSF